MVLVVYQVRSMTWLQDLSLPCNAVGMVLHNPSDGAAYNCALGEDGLVFCSFAMERSLSCLAAQQQVYQCLCIEAARDALHMTFGLL